jgi:hypothetical protein
MSVLGTISKASKLKKVSDNAKPLRKLTKVSNKTSAARAKDAKSMGFQEPTMYHGTRSTDIKEFKQGKAEKTDDGWYGEGTYTTPKPLEASEYAGYNKHVDYNGSDESIQTGGNVIPLKLKSEKPLIVDGYGLRAFKLAISKKYGDKILDGLVNKSTKEGEFDQVMFNHKATEFLKKDGHDSVWVGYEKTPTAMDDADEVVIFDSKNTRSVNAEFDKKKASSGDLLAGVAGTAVGGKTLTKVSDKTREEEDGRSN